MEEIEVKFLNIDPNSIDKKLKSLGAERIFERLYRRRVFDYPDLRLDKQGAWLRIRDEGDKVTMSYKQRLGMKDREASQNDKSMEEIETTVGNFEKMAEIMLKIGLTEKFYQENRRIRYMLKDIEFDIDFWPELEPYLEIEAPSWEKVNEGIRLLGLEPGDKKIMSSTQIYGLKGIVDTDYKEMTFKGMIKK